VSVVVVLLIIILGLLLAGSIIGLAFSLLWLGLTGLVIGALGRLVIPGRHDISLLATALVGIAASLLGGILADAFDVGGIIQFLVAVTLAAIGITVFASSEHRRVA
jgi:uncharacterized membrane protein YeaQ/YmgE (transglycosylase-associated protein family)